MTALAGVSRAATSCDALVAEMLGAAEGAALGIARGGGLRFSLLHHSHLEDRLWAVFDGGRTDGALVVGLRPLTGLVGDCQVVFGRAGAASISLNSIITSVELPIRTGVVATVALPPAGGAPRRVCKFPMQTERAFGWGKRGPTRALAEVVAFGAGRIVAYSIAPYVCLFLWGEAVTVDVALSFEDLRARVGGAPAGGDTGITTAAFATDTATFSVT